MWTSQLAVAAKRLTADGLPAGPASSTDTVENGPRKPVETPRDGGSGLRSDRLRTPSGGHPLPRRRGIQATSTATAMEGPSADGPFPGLDDQGTVEVADASGAEQSHGAVDVVPQQ
jgi:hypothetical protein